MEEKEVIEFENIKFYDMKLVKMAIKEYTDFNIRKCHLPKGKKVSEELYNLYDLLNDKKTNDYARRALIKVGTTIRDILTFLNINCKEIKVDYPGWYSKIGLYNFEDKKIIKIIKDYYDPKILHVIVKSKDKERNEYYTIVDGKYYDGDNKISLEFRNGQERISESLENGYKYDFLDSRRGREYTYLLSNKKYHLKFETNPRNLKDTKEVSSIIKNLTLPTNFEELLTRISNNIIIKDKRSFNLLLWQGKNDQENREQFSDYILIQDGELKYYKTTDNNGTLVMNPEKYDSDYYTYDKKEESYNYHVESPKEDGANSTIVVSAANGFNDVPSSEEIYTEASIAYQKSLGVIRKFGIK